MNFKPSPWPDGLEDELWAKSAAKGADGAPESLAYHTWQVLKRLAGFIELRPALPARLRRPSLWHCLYWATFLHDFGKAMPLFQGVLRGDRRARDEWGGHRHEVFSLAFIDWLSPGLGDDDLVWAAAAIASHHRDRDKLALAYPTPEPGEADPLADMLATLPARYVAGLYDWLAASGGPWALHLGLDTLGVAPISFPDVPPPFRPAGAARRIRHWLRQFNQLAANSGATGFVAPITLRGYILSADHSGSAGAPALPRVAFSREQVLAGRNLTLYDHQEAAAKAVGSILLIAPTGTGKTEAALLWAARQAADGNAPRLFYTLPYQASMNAMLRRLAETFGDAYVGVQHGRALLATYRWLMEQGEQPENAARTSRQRRDLARLHLPPVRVFSPYQMLKGMYRLKGYEAQLTDYHDGLFIFDEIHAYEVRRLALILRTIAYLRCHYNARFLVMSATFPTLIREWLAEALGESLTITAAPALYDQFQRHRIRLVEGEALDEANLARVAQAARSGQSVLLVCNVVARAQQAHDWLRAQLAPDGIDTVLLHGRFNMRDRQIKEQTIRERTGTERGDGRPIVLVATQAVEVSLDIDLDTLYSDPAPLEALVQRFGRVNRRGRKVLADVHIFTTSPDAQKKIYDERLVAGALRVLAREDGHPVDESAIGRWLDEIYEDEIADEWRKTFTATAAEFDAVVVNTLRPFQSDLGIEQQFDALFDGMEVLPAGENDIILNEYERLVAEGRTIEASELLVPISYRQYHQNRRANALWSCDESQWPIVVLAPYSPEGGLDLSQLTRRTQEEEEPGL